MPNYVTQKERFMRLKGLKTGNRDASLSKTNIGLSRTQVKNLFPDFH